MNQCNYNDLPAKERLALLFSDKSVDWEKFGIPKSTIKSILGEDSDQDAKLIARVHEIQMMLLDELLEFCNKHNLKCIAMYGTLLGAVRNGGLIPGDDDVDIALLREDYDKLMDLLRQSEANGHAGGEGDFFSNGIFLQTTWNEDCFYGGYIKLRYSNSTAIFPQDWWVNCNQGISIDVFALDAGYKSKFREWVKNQKICFLQRMLYAKVYGRFPRFQDMPLLIFKGYKYFGKLFSKQKLIDCLEKTFKQGDKLNYKAKKQPFGVYGHYTKGKGPRKMPIKTFENLTKVDYEGRTLYAPYDYNSCLKFLYGKMCMISNQEEYGKQRHAFYAPNVPYQSYRERMQGLFKSVPSNKKVVLFGDETFMPYYANAYSGFKPDFIVESGVRDIEDEKKFIESLGALEEEEGLETGTIYKKTCPSQGMKLNEMSLDSPYSYRESSVTFTDKEYTSAEDFFTSNLNLDDYYFVICSLFIRETEGKLRTFGVRDYHIFVPGFNRDIIKYEDPRYGLLYTNVK